MATNPIYIKSLNLKNVRRFEEVNINFLKEDGVLPQWTLILGDNGIGKTTLLQSIGWMKPLVHNARDSEGETLKKENIEPSINNETNETLEELVNNNNFSSARIHATFIANSKINEKADLPNEKICTSEIEIELDGGKKLKDVKLLFDTNAEEIFFEDEVLILPYSASRRLGKSNIYEPDLADPFLLFSFDDTKLFDIEEILHTVNYASLGSDKKESAKHKKYRSTVLDMLKSMLPSHDEVKNIEISVPKIVNNVLRAGTIEVVYKNRKRVAYSNLSLGYRSVLALSVDISWRMFNSYPNSENPLAEPAIVLLDEIDLHLHPLWQREVIEKLSLNFPNVQFVATAHSPLIVQSAINANYEIVKDADGKVIVISDTENIEGWRIDQILTSDFFGLSTSRGPEIEKKIAQRRELLKKGNLNETDSKTLRELNEKIYDLPVGDNKDEIDAMSVLRNFAKELNQIKTGKNDKNK
ncbi:hypothetical protein RT99_13920 [Flavobacterium sp. MEB061]|uniref:AAA family ATPase n=1 Tax=Flavobacterium sp. MEB061 TaxID=1587524 RepID=UPI0005AC3618|nr:AAA family ATPase [Flavobacterium sp. MEB061]KIQ20170.1 hypothetical protein RT99_13920 [Flavobacterium sp. MEB061]